RAAGDAGKDGCCCSVGGTDLLGPAISEGKNTSLSGVHHLQKRLVAAMAEHKGVLEGSRGEFSTRAPGIVFRGNGAGTFLCDNEMFQSTLLPSFNHHLVADARVFDADRNTPRIAALLVKQNLDCQGDLRAWD